MDLAGAADLSALQVKKAETAGPYIRLLLCLDCKTIEELPDFDGPPEYDHLLQLAIDERHTNWTSETAHRGQLIKVEIKHWAVESIKREIVRQIRDGSGGISELDPAFYDTKSQFAADALDCFARHLRPRGQCVDYMHDSKKLVPKTKSDRKDLGLPDPKYATNLPKLCQFCPVHVYNVTKARQASGANA